MLKATRTYIFTVIFLFSTFTGIFSQSTDDRTLRMMRIRDLFSHEMYSASEKEIEEYLSVYPETDGLALTQIEAYKVLCTILLRRPNIDGSVSGFESRYPFAYELPLVKFYQSKYYFDSENYPKSLQILNSIRDKNLPKAEKVECIYNRAYCSMRVGNNDEAVTGFEKVLKYDDGRYTSSATYYLAYLYYLIKDFDKAVSFFEKITDDGNYGPQSRYFLLESHLMKKDYPYVIANKDSVYAVVNDETKGKVARIVSEAFFALNDSQQAKQWFELYSRSGADLTSKDNYYSGIISYSLRSYISAADAFSKMANKSDSLGQSAFYHMGNAYLHLKNKRAAMDAYKNASECDFDPTITSEASFQYAKLLFDLNTDISAFQAYLKKYPSTAKSDEIYYYIATSYLLTKNYKAAINAINQIHGLTPQMSQNLQKAAFFRGMQLLERGAYKGAITDFQIAIRNGSQNPRLTLLTKYWMAEAQFRSNEFDQAIKIGNELMKSSTFRSSGEYPLAQFNLGYAYFRKYQFSDAIIWFESYLATNPTSMLLATEAKTRLADSYFMLKEYEKAVEIYSGIVSSGYATDIYASYQGAVCYGLLSQDAKKIGILRNILEEKSDSPLFPMAVYELGRTYVQVDDPEKASECFNVLIVDVRDSVYYSKSLLELGMIASNQGEYEKALQYFKRVVEEAPMSEDSRSALAGMESIYQMLNKPEVFLAYIEQLGMSSMKTADERELMLFNSAEQIFLSERYPEALDALQSFIAAYPDGAKTTHAYFYLGRTLVNLNKEEEAAEAFKRVMDIGDESFSELSALYYARISYNLEKYPEAIGAYEMLYSIAKIGNNKKEAVTGLMRSYFKNGDYADAAIKATNLNTVEAQYILSKSLLALDRRDEAIPVLKTLSADPDSKEGAEAAYLLIQDAYDVGDFESVANQVYAFSDSKSSQNYWLAKSFIVLGDSFAEQEEWEQAKATFQSIKDGYEPVSEHDDVLEQVDMRLSKLQQVISE